MLLGVADESLTPPVPVPVVVPVMVNVLSPRGVGNVVAMVKVEVLAPATPSAVGKDIGVNAAVVPAGLAVKVKKFVSVGSPNMVEVSSKVTVAV